MTERTSPSLPVQPVPEVTMPKRRTPLRQTASARESSSAGSSSPYSGTCAAWWADWAQKRQFSGQAPDLALTIEQACRPGAYFSRTLWASEIRSRTSSPGSSDRRVARGSSIGVPVARTSYASSTAGWMTGRAHRSSPQPDGSRWTSPASRCSSAPSAVSITSSPVGVMPRAVPRTTPERFSAATGLPVSAECRSK